MPWVKIGIAVAVVLGLLGAGYWFSGVLTERAALRKEVKTLTAQNAANEAALASALKKGKIARDKADKGKNEIQNSTDQAVRDWGAQPLPDGVRRALQ